MALEVSYAWAPISSEEVGSIFTGAPFFWCLAGGPAIERVVGGLREKDDLDFTKAIPHLTVEHRTNLVDWLSLTNPEGHPWLKRLATNP